MVIQWVYPSGDLLHFAMENDLEFDEISRWSMAIFKSSAGIEAMMIWCSNQGPTTVALFPFNALFFRSGEGIKGMNGFM